MSEDSNHKNDENAVEDNEPLWLVAVNNVQSLLNFMVFFLIFPWRYYYEHVLLWDETRGTSVFFGALAVMSAISLVFRAISVDVTKTPWTKLEDRNVLMCGSFLSSAVFWTGMYLWGLYKELGVSRDLCFAIVLLGGVSQTYLLTRQIGGAKRPWVTTAFVLAIVFLTISYVSGIDLLG